LKKKVLALIPKLEKDINHQQEPEAEAKKTKTAKPLKLINWDLDLRILLLQ